MNTLNSSSKHEPRLTFDHENEYHLQASTKKVLTKARENHWRFVVVGEGAMIPSPMYRDGWWYMPLERPDSIICGKQFEKIKMVSDICGIQGVIVAHESPKMFGGSQKPWCAPKPVELPQIKVNWTAVGTVTLTIAKILGLVLLSLVSALGIAFGAMFDPTLIVVTKSGTWIEVATWYE